MQYAILTRPKQAYAVNKLSQFIANPLIPHWIACEKVLRYLKNTVNFKLKFHTLRSFDLIGYCDVDYGCDTDDRKSVNGYHIYLCENLVSWSSKKQVVARSTAKSEYNLCTNDLECYCKYSCNVGTQSSMHELSVLR